ncbi:MAG: TspO/MBR family protein [Pirellulaceae bacterium]
MDWQTWYESLHKPSWTPSPGTIGLIWQIVYPVLLGSIVYLFWKASQGRISWWLVLPFLVNLVFNLAFIPLMFGLRSLWLAAFDIVMVWLTIGWMIAVVARPLPAVAVAQIPYLIWVTIAMVLQWSIVWRNR